MALTKGNEATLDATQEVAQNTLVEGSEGDISDAYEAALGVWFATTNTTAHTGTEFVVEVSNAASGDEGWREHVRWVSKTGTGNTEVITNNPAAADETILTVADTTGYVTNGAVLFLEDVSTFANSEWVRQKTYATNTSVTIVDGTAREHAQNSILNNVAENKSIGLPPGARRVRVLVNNCYDADGATIAFRTVLAKVTGI